MFAICPAGPSSETEYLLLTPASVDKTCPHSLKVCFYYLYIIRAYIMYDLGSNSSSRWQWFMSHSRSAEGFRVFKLDTTAPHHHTLTYESSISLPYTPNRTPPFASPLPVRAADHWRHLVCSFPDCLPTR